MARARIAKGAPARVGPPGAWLNHNQGGPTMTKDTAAALLARADAEALTAPCPVCRAPRGQSCAGPAREDAMHSSRRALCLAEIEATGAYVGREPAA